MSFPYDDPDWVAAAAFVAAHRQPDETILAPDAFVFRVPRIARYANTRLRPDTHYDWAALHLWMLDALAPAYLAGLHRVLRPVFANGTFILFARNAALPRLGRFDPGWRRFRRRRREVLAAGDTPPPPQLFDVPDEGGLKDFARLSRAEIKREMEPIFAKGGYHTPTLRDREYMAEMDRLTGEFMGDPAGLRILDLACGDGRAAQLAAGCAELIGVDLAETPLRVLAAEAQPGRHYAVMAAEQLALPNAYFDLVVFIEAVEHVVDFEATAAEIARVTRPGGRLIVTSQNSGSLHLVLNRKLGYPNYFTSYQHFREFTPAELGARLAAHGFRVLRSSGIWLSPYWEIPGIDRPTRHATDNDPELVGILRQLGRKIGADHAHTFILLAEKVA
ncbi:MAG: class I SAM-dependent methyltransferase [Rhodospirillaceae bacterium]|nr:class I SAM-dependent methyltransferase [Rhodospirillaceae bacterium]